MSVINDVVDTVAVKVVEPKFWKAFQDEVTSLWTLQGHPNIVKMLHYEYSKCKQDQQLLFLEYCGAGDLFDLVKESNGLDEATVA